MSEKISEFDVGLLLHELKLEDFLIANRVYKIMSSMHHESTYRLKMQVFPNEIWNIFLCFCMSRPRLTVRGLWLIPPFYQVASLLCCWSCEFHTAQRIRLESTFQTLHPVRHGDPDDFLTMFHWSVMTIVLLHLLCFVTLTFLTFWRWLCFWSHHLCLCEMPGIAEVLDAMYDAAFGWLLRPILIIPTHTLS